MKKFCRRIGRSLQKSGRVLARASTTGLVVLLFAHPRPTGAVTYRATFQAAWSAVTHAGAFPEGAHFSPLVGGTHDDSISFWQPGGLATPGMELMAETGGTSTLLQEIDAAIMQGRAESTILGSGLSDLPNSTSVSFDAEPSHPLLTLVTMVAPSPDWFLGVTGLALRDAEGWIGRQEVDLLTWDAGTDDGLNFTSPNAESQPHVPISLLTQFPLKNLPPLGKFTLTIESNGLAGDFDLDGSVGASDAERWVRGFGALLVEGATVVDGDANGDGVVDGTDFLAWQGGFGASLGAGAISVPEPYCLTSALAAAVLFGATRRGRKRFATKQSSDVC